MNESEIRQKVVTTAKKYLDCKEADGSHKKFIDRYNSFQPLPRNHRMTYSAAWCATFVSAVSIECGLTDIMPVECGCGYMISAYKKLGRWQEKDDYTPKAGDVIFYDWDDGKDFATTDDKGAPEHVYMTLYNFCVRIPQVVIDEDNRKYPLKPGTSTETLSRIMEWYRQRLAFIDNEVYGDKFIQSNEITEVLTG